MTSPGVQRLRGLFAALALLAFVVGTPCGLLALGADPARSIPDRWPDLAPISQWPERIWNTLRWAWLTGDLVVALVVVVAWAGWLLLTLSVTAEVIRQTRHGVRTARGALARVPRGRWIAGLVAAALVLISSGTASALPATGSPIVATAQHRPPYQTHATVEPVSERADSPARHEPSRNWVDPSVRPDCPRITAHQGDTVWGLAEYHLGDGRRYHEIEHLNADRVPNAHELYPHDVLLLPPDAMNLPADAPEPGSNVRTVPVEPGDTLSAIAESELGDAEAWPALFEANRGLPQPDGRVLRHPDQVLPGWQIHLPAAAAANPAAAGPPAAPPGPAPPPPAPASSSPTARPTSAPSPGHAEGTQVDRHTPVQLPGGGLVGLGLALSVAILLVLARRRRRARRNPTGRLTPADHYPGLPDPARPGSVIEMLDHAAQRATHRHDTEPDEDEQYRDDVLARSGEDDSIAARRRRVWPPPAPVMTAHTDTGAQALDLSATAGLALTGPGAAPVARAVLATVLAVDARYPAQALLADPATAELVAGGADLAALQQAPGVEVTDDETAALARLRTELARRARLRDDDQLDADLHRGDDADERPGDIAGPVPLLLVAARPSPQHRREWATIGDQGRAVGIHALFLGDDRLHEAGDFTKLALDADGTIAAAHGPGTESAAGVRAETLAPAEADEIWRLLAAARTPAPRQPHDDATLDPHSKAEAAHGDGGVGAASGASHDQRPTTSVDENRPAVVVRLLGGVRVHAHGDHVRGLRARAREVLAYLAAHPHGTTADALREAVLPDQPAARLHEAISYARSALRTATGDNEAAFVLAESGRYRLDSDTITADVWALEDSLTRARTTSDPDTRLNALRRLARVCRAGAPLEGAPYSWAEPVAEHWRSQVVDALVALAGEVRNHNPDEALDALAVAITWDPYTEALYQRTIALQRDLGRLDAAHTIYRRLQTNLRDIDLEPDPNTTALLDKSPVPQR
jgi:nucleoid-associated protein YgaU/DNA-binding SARP family transcriptional activator